MSKTKTKLTIQAELRAQTEEQAQTSNFRCVFYADNLLSVAGWPRPVHIQVAGLRFAPTIPVLREHQADLDHVIGRVIDYEVDVSANTLYGTIVLYPLRAQDVIDLLVANKHPVQLSVGVRDIVAHDDGDIIEVTSGELYEVSVVAIGADKEAHIMAKVKAQDVPAELPQEFLDWLGSLGIDPNSLSDEAKQQLFIMWQAQQQQAQPQDQSQDQPQQAQSQDQTAQDQQDGSTDSEDDDEDEDQTNPPPVTARDPLTRSPRRSRITLGHAPAYDIRATIEDALVIRAGYQPRRKVRDELVNQISRMSLVEIAQTALQAAGVTLPRFASRYDILRAAFSTRSLATILSSVLRRLLLEGYAAEPKLSLQVGQVVDIPDFKPYTATRLVAGPQLPEVLDGGTVAYVSAREQTYQLAVKTYGGVLKLTRRDIINDDLGVITKLPVEFGRLAASSLEAQFWALFNSPPSGFFDSTNSLSSTQANVNGVSAALGVLEGQVDEFGSNLGLTGALIVSPNALYAPLQSIYASNIFYDGSIPASNPYVGMFPVVKARRLTATNTWYMLADPRIAPAFLVGVLRGQTEPTVEEVQLPPEEVGMGWRVLFDFGVGVADRKCVVKVSST